MTGPSSSSGAADVRGSALGRYSPPMIVALCFVLWVAQLCVDYGGVGFVTAIVVWLILWWMVFFAVLPIRIRGQFETGEVVEGSEPGAPVDPMLGRKVWTTTVVASALWLVYFVVIEFGLIGLESIPFLPTYEPVR